jgi:hypothetical protein
MFKKRPENVGIPESEAWAAFQEEERARMAEAEGARAEARMLERYPIDFLTFAASPENVGRDRYEVFMEWQERERARMAEEARNESIRQFTYSYYQDVIEQLNDDPYYIKANPEEKRQMLQQRIAQIDDIIGIPNAIDYLDPASDLIIPN